MRPENQLTWRCGSKKEIHQQFRWFNDIPYRDSERREHIPSVLECVDTRPDAEGMMKKTKFKWVTNVPVSAHNAAALANEGGRSSTSRPPVHRLLRIARAPPVARRPHYSRLTRISPTPDAGSSLFFTDEERLGLRQKSGFSSGSLFPILIEAIGLNKASQRGNGVCASDGPFHTGVLHTLANDRPARHKITQFYDCNIDIWYYIILLRKILSDWIQFRP